MCRFVVVQQAWLADVTLLIVVEVSNSICVVYICHILSNSMAHFAVAGIAYVKINNALVAWTSLHTVLPSWHM